MRRSARVVLFLSLVASTAAAQPLPKARTYDLLVADGSFDRIVRLPDLTQEGLYTIPGEWGVFYEGAVAGGPVTGTPSSVAFDRKGYAYVADTGLDAILRLIDMNGDGDANDAGEWNVWFSNANGVVTITSLLAIAIDADGVLYATNAGAGATPDFVLRAEDGDGDGDAEDAGEATMAYVSGFAGTTIAVPTAIAIDPSNGDLLVSDVNPDAIWRMRDTDVDGFFATGGEVTLAYSGIQPGQPGLMQASGLAFGPDGDLFVDDTIFDRVFRLTDLDADGDYEDAGEASLWADVALTLGGPSNAFVIEVDENGRAFLTENLVGDFVLRYADGNNDGDALDAGDVAIVFDGSQGPGPIDQPRSLALVPAPTLSAPNGTTVLAGQNLDLLVHGTAFDLYFTIVGLAPLPAPLPVPPYGTLAFLPVIPVLSLGFLDGDGDDLLSYPIPAAGLVLPTTLIVGAAAGKLPYRLYLANDLTITVQ